ncbi:tetratricopeptide repeat protein [Chromobacterium sp. CV08]|uniref:tetratricopeptide repeat protein n=1 Tax=Chromobacterium sp. CV08 TaxID=3133274 RepID=UPI003DA90C4E
MHIALENIQQLRQRGEHETARQQTLELLRHQPQHADLHYLAACIHDSLGLEADAIPHYQQALELGLSGETAAEAWLGLGSSHRALGRFDEAETALQEGLRQFPEHHALRAFLAMAQYNLGRHKEATQGLLALLADGSADHGIRAYRRAIHFYAQDLDRTW